MIFLRFLVFLTFPLLLVACGVSQPATPVQTESQSTATPAATPEPPTSTPTSSPTPSASPTPTVAATDTPTTTPTPEPTLPPFPPTISLEPQLNLSTPIVYLTHANDGSNRIFVVETAGRVRIISAGELLPTPFLDISNLVESGGSEQGLLSMAFAPGYDESGVFYVNYTSRAGDGDTVIARYHVSDDPNIADPDSGQIVLTIDQPARNHNGGQIQFGPDGYLYVGTGDGGSAGDPWDNAENRYALLGKMLRLDVKGRETYDIPIENPFPDGESAAPEVWAYGLRNPWRFSFDRATGDLYIGDVGQGSWEEVDFQSAASRGGEDYGWNTMEGAHCYQPAQNCETSGSVPPIFDYDHSQGCSITGGYVYRGADFPALAGTYLFGDYCSGRIWGLRQDASGNWQSALLLASGINISSFGEDEAGELYVLDLQGQIYRVIGQ
ncbi:MAG: PQQ-dependent sugar dehydrogenase [Caldilineales bacterium]|nr:PQQ-dependent sugar dehydrogenase [Caldilineales bacterium]